MPPPPYGARYKYVDDLLHLVTPWLWLIVVCTLGECLAVTVHSKSRRSVALSWRRCNSCDDSASAYELPPATYNNLQVSGSTDRAGTQNTRQRNTLTRTHAARRSQSPKGGVQLHKQPDGTMYYHSRPTLI